MIAPASSSQLRHRRQSGMPKSITHLQPHPSQILGFHSACDDGPAACFLALDAPAVGEHDGNDLRVGAQAAAQVMTRKSASVRGVVLSTVHDHRRSKADTPVPSGTYAQKKSSKVGVLRHTKSVAVLSPGHRATGSTTTSSVNAASGQPPGFGTTITWTDETDLAVVAFIAASDELGVAVEGVKSGDTIEFHSSVGTATFAQETRNQGVASAITIVAAGAGLTAAAFGAPELTPLITAAGAQISKQFPEKKENAKARDVYGQIPGSNEFARQEGGLLICSPAVQGIWHSGDDDHKDRWIKSSKDRSDSNRPAHVKDAFFLQRSAGPRTLVGDGEMIIAPWDLKFGDNVGVYRVNFILKRKASSDPVIE